MKPSILILLAMFFAAAYTPPAQAIGSLTRDQGTLSEVDKTAIESMRDRMGDRPDAQYAIGRLYERGGLDREALNWMRKSAEGGNPMAKMWMSEQKVKAEFRNSRGRMLSASRRGLGAGE